MSQKNRPSFCLSLKVTKTSHIQCEYMAAIRLAVGAVVIIQLFH